MTLSKRYAGVYYNALNNGDKSYHITYKNGSKKEWFKIGLHSEGIREAYCSKYRADILLKLRLGDKAPKTLKNNIKYTVDQLSFDFFLHKRYKGGTKRTIEGRYAKHITPTLGDIEVQKLTFDDVKKLYDDKIDDEELADKTCGMIIDILSGMMNYAIEEKEIIHINPCKKLKKVKIDNARERFLSKEEVLKLIKATEHDKDIHLFTLLSLSTGARLHDIYTLKKKDFNLSQKIVTIKNNKTNSTYKAFLNKRALIALHLSSLKVNEILYDVSERVIQRRLQNLLNSMFNAGLDTKDSKNRVVIHTLRHTFASHLAIAGTPIFTIKELLNHKEIEQTLRYAKLSPDSGREFVENLF